jgi:riboflavin biosynthesis pyrimidine reductase
VGATVDNAELPTSWHHRPVMTPPPLRRVHPAPHEPITIAEAYAVERTPHDDRPWVGLCMVSSLDGTVAVEGTSGALGNPNDLEVLLTLRSIADMLIVGSGTVRGEGYGPPKKPGQRLGVVTNRGSVDLDSPLFTSGAGFVIAPESAEIDEDRVEVLRAGEDTVDLVVAFSRLREIDATVRYVQAEGGPTLNAALLEVDLIDELDLTIASRLSGGAGPRLTDGADELDRRFDVEHLLVDDDGFVFGRWTRRR